MLCRAYRRQYGCDFIATMPTNLFGPGDKFDPLSSHVLPALIAKTHAAKQAGERELVVWGSGTPLREFMYVDDLADVLVFLLKNYSYDEHVNVGVGSEMTIRQVAEMVMRVVGFEGQLKFDSSKPDGAPRKLLDSSSTIGHGLDTKDRHRNRIGNDLSAVPRPGRRMRHQVERSARVSEIARQRNFVISQKCECCPTDRSLRDLRKALRSSRHHPFQPKPLHPRARF